MFSSLAQITLYFSANV